MRQSFETMEVARSLGVAPSTAAIIAGLLSGEVDPDHCRSIEYWALSDLDAPPQYFKVLAAIAKLLGLKNGCVKECEIVKGKEGLYIEYMKGQPTVVWTGGKFLLGKIK